MYHTQQAVHLQGGKRLSKITSTGLVASVLEKQWTKLREDNREAIAKNTESFAKIYTAKFEQEVQEKSKTVRKPKYNCPKCDYKGVFLHEFERHKTMVHNSKLMLKKSKRSYYDSDNNEDDNKRTKKTETNSGDDTTFSSQAVKHYPWSSSLLRLR